MSMPDSASRLRCVRGGSAKLTHNRFTNGRPSPIASATITCDTKTRTPRMSAPSNTRNETSTTAARLQHGSAKTYDAIRQTHRSAASRLPSTPSRVRLRKYFNIACCPICATAPALRVRTVSYPPSPPALPTSLSPVKSNTQGSNTRTVLSQHAGGVSPHPPLRLLYDERYVRPPYHYTVSHRAAQYLGFYPEVADLYSIAGDVAPHAPPGAATRLLAELERNLHVRGGGGTREA